LDCKKSLLFPIPNLNTLRKNNCSEKQRWRRQKSWKNDPLCNKSIKEFFLIKKTMKERKKKDRKNQRLTESSHMSITHFWYWTFQSNPKPHCAIGKNVLLMWVQLKVQNWSLNFWPLELCLKWPIMKWSYVKKTTIIMGKTKKSTQ
jgi:hypothetical protein